MPNENIITAEYTSVWDGAIAISAECKINLKTREIFDILPAGDNLLEEINQLTEQYVNINGRRYPAVEQADMPKHYTGYWYKL